MSRNTDSMSQDYIPEEHQLLLWLNTIIVS